MSSSSIQTHPPNVDTGKTVSPSTGSTKYRVSWSRGDTLLWLFGPLLFVSLALYIFFHLPNSWLPLQAQVEQAKSEVLKQIVLARKAAVLGAEPQPNPQLSHIVFEPLRENLNLILTLYTNSVVVEKAAALEREAARAQVNSETVQQLLSELDQEVRNWHWYFWSTVPWRWVEILAWSWFGTLTYLLTQIYEHYRVMNTTEDPARDDGREQYFVLNTPRYFVIASRGPLTAYVILLFVSSIRLGGTGIEITPEQVSIELLVFLASVLGFYNRVATEQLNLIVAAVFSEAWKRTQRRLEIEPRSASIAFGEVQFFKVEPDVSMRWEIEPPRCGTIDRESGTYTAPGKGSEYRADTQVTIRATRVDDPTVSSVVVVTLHDAE